MRKRIKAGLLPLLLALNSCMPKAPDNFIWVEGGRFMNGLSSFYKKGANVAGFYMGVYEVTQKEWTEVMGSNPSEFKGDGFPVETVSWYECVEYCNKRSIKEGLTPYYTLHQDEQDGHNSNAIDDIKWKVELNTRANGYRLPTEAEWEYAAGGGQLSKGYTYSGSNSIDDVAWYWRNSGEKYLNGNWSWPELERNHNRAKPVGSKAPNELGLYDMSGNVREWCWEWHEPTGPYDAQGRIWKGGGWMGGDFCCALSFQASHEANGKGPDQGFRVCRNR